MAGPNTLPPQTQGHSVSKPKPKSQPSRANKPTPSATSSSSLDQPSRKSKQKISRLRTGCWTCRRRGYKCDEGKPHCKNCIRLNLDCEGYGIRLKWQDDGYFNQSQIASGKSVIGRKGNHKRNTTFNISTPESMASDSKIKSHLFHNIVGDTSSSSSKDTDGSTYQRFAAVPHELEHQQPTAVFHSSASQSYFGNGTGAISFLVFDGEKNTFSPTSPSLAPTTSSKSSASSASNNDPTTTTTATTTTTPTPTPTTTSTQPFDSLTYFHSNDLSSINETNPPSTLPSNPLASLSTHNQLQNDHIESSLLGLTANPTATTTASNTTNNISTASFLSPSIQTSQKLTAINQLNSVLNHNVSNPAQQAQSNNDLMMNAAPFMNEMYSKVSNYLSFPQFPISAPFANDTSAGPSSRGDAGTSLESMVYNTIQGMEQSASDKRSADKLNKIVLGRKLIEKIVVDLGDGCSLPLRTQQIPGRKSIMDVAINAARFGDPEHPFNKYPTSHMCSYIQQSASRGPIPTLPLGLSVQVLANTPAVLEMMSARFQTDARFWFGYTIPNGKLVTSIAKMAKSCIPLLYAVCAMSSANIADQYLFINNSTSNGDQQLVSNLQYQMYSDLKTEFYERAKVGLQQGILRGYTDDLLSCSIILADLSRSNSDFKAWGEMLDISVHGFYDYVNRIGEETLFTSVVADPSAKPGHYEVFWGICDVIGGHDVLWTLTTDRAPRMLDVYRRYWRYIPSVPAIAVENMAPYLAFSRYIMGFLSEIYGLSAAVKNKEPITSIPTFHHMSDIVRYLYAAKKSSFNPEDIDNYLDLRHRLDIFQTHFVKESLQKVPYFYPLARFISLCTKICFMLRLDSSEDIAISVAYASNSESYRNMSSKNKRIYCNAYKVHEIKEELFECLEELDPRKSNMSCSAAALSQNPGSGSLFGVLDTMTMILPSCVFMAGIVSSTEHEQDLVRAFVEELYARVPTAGIGSMWQFCELLWKLRPAVEADIDVSNISPTEYYTYKDQGDQPASSGSSNSSSSTSGGSLDNSSISTNCASTINSHADASQTQSEDLQSLMMLSEIKSMLEEGVHIQPPDISLPWNHLQSFPFELFILNSTPESAYQQGQFNVGISSAQSMPPIRATHHMTTTTDPMLNTMLVTAASNSSSNQSDKGVYYTSNIELNILERVAGLLEQSNLCTVKRANNNDQVVVTSEYMRLLSLLSRRDILALIVDVCGTILPF